MIIKKHTLVPNREPKSSPDAHVKFAEMEHLKSEYHDIYESLMRTFKNDVRVMTG